VGKAQPVSTSIGTQFRQEIDYNSVDGRYLVAYADDRDSSTNGFDIRGQLLKNRGQVLGTEITISDAVGDQIKPIVSHNSVNNNYLVVWTDFRNGNFDIYGQIVG